MADSGANVQINVSKPAGVEAAAAGFYQLAKAASEAAKEVKGAQSAGSAFSQSLKKENRESRSGSRKQAAAEAAKQAEIDYEASKKQKHADTQKAEKEHKERHANRVGNIRSVSGGATGMLSKMGPHGQIAAAVIEAVGKVADGITKGAELINDSYQTGAQKMRGFVSEFVPLGDKFIKMADAIEGITDAINRQREKMEITKAQDSAGFAMRAKLGAANVEDVGFRARAVAYNRFGIVGSEKFDRSTVAGERGAQHQDMTIGAHDDLTRANREAFAARVQAKQAAENVAAADKRVRDQQAKVDAAQGRLGDNTIRENAGMRDKAGRDKASREVENERARLAQELAARETVIAAAKDKGLAAAQAEAAARAASVNLAKQELAYLEQQEARMRSIAQGVGGMSQGERMASLNALKAYQEAGGNAPPEIEALVGRLAPDLVRKNQENRGADFIQNDVRNALGDKDFAAAFGNDFGKGNTLKDVMAKVDAAKADIRVTIDLDAGAMANQLANILKPVLDNLKASFKVEVENVEKRIKAGNITRNNQVN